MDDRLLADLNPAQRDAVLHRGTPLLVVAGPGSGKTRVVTRRVAWSVLHGWSDARGIVAITFTNRAAAEMRDRVAALIGPEQQPRIGTFHWFCHGLLRRHADRVGGGRAFSLLAPHESGALLAECCRDAAPGRVSPGPARSAMSAVKNGLPLALAAARWAVAPGDLNAVLDAYERRLSARRALDLDDLLLQAVRLLETRDDLRVRIQSTLGDLLIDEYQDTNPVQLRLIDALLPRNGNLIAVGDEDQAIYGWRQASGDAFSSFQARHQGGRVIVLTETYRTGKQILRAASAMVARNSGRLEKPLHTAMSAGDPPLCIVAHDEVDEARWIAREIERLVAAGETRVADIAVLYRVNGQSRAIEEALVRAGIRYRVLGARRFYDRAEARSVLSALRLAVDRSDDAAMTHLLLQLSGLGHRRLDALQSRAAGRSLLEAAGDPAVVAVLPEAVRSRCAALVAALRDGEAGRSRPTAGAIEWAIEVAGLVHDVPASDPDAGVLAELRSALRSMAGSRGTIGTLIAALPLQDDSGPAEDGVRLMSLHAAKGLEFDTVFLAGVEEGLLPHRHAMERADGLEEERRLCYVGVTRTKRKLYMTYTRTRTLGGRALQGSISRFVAEMGRGNVRLRSTGRRTVHRRLSAVRPGDRVRHDRWHNGTVVAIEGMGRETLVTIQFEDVGSRRLQLCHAPLRRLD